MRTGLQAAFSTILVAGLASPSQATAQPTAIDTTIGVRYLPSISSLHRDINGDGIVTDADLVLQLLEILGPGPEPDVDGDGVLTAADTVAAVEKILQGSCADVDGSGEVDEADLTEVTTAVLDESDDPGFDANTDGMVSGEDVLFVLEHVGESWYLTGAWSGACAWLASYLQTARVEGTETLWESQADTADHHLAITEEWTNLPGHEFSVSRTQWPPNHMGPHSRAWPSERSTPAHARTLSKLWPPSHDATISRGWNTAHVRLTSYQEEVHYTQSSTVHDMSTSYRNGYFHHLDTSYRWDTTHDAWLSARWRSTPNHRRMASIRWDPSGPGQPDDHQVIQSRLWPANHERFYSNRDRPIVPRTHEQAVTQGWDDYNHFPNVSSGWPPMHYLYYSGTWQHVNQFSMVFPPNHHGAVSGFWPPRMLPGQWPANHLRLTTEREGTPNPSLGPENWPLWPQDHSWFTTIREIITLPADALDPFIRSDSGAGD